ncbi:MAG: hypothetical protein U0169_12680 [Polyangiaceae bacterium]
MPTRNVPSPGPRFFPIPFARVFRGMIVASSLAAVACGGATDGTDTTSIESQDAITVTGVGAKLAGLVERFRGEGLAKAVVGEMDTALRSAKDVPGQRRALQELIGVAIPKDVEPEAFVASMKRALVSLDGDSVNGQAMRQVDGMFADLLGSMDAIATSMKGKGVDPQKLSELLVAVSWSQEARDVERSLVGGLFHTAIMITKEPIASMGDADKLRRVTYLLNALLGRADALGDEGAIAKMAEKLIESVGSIRSIDDPAKFPHAFLERNYKEFFGIEYPKAEGAVAILVDTLDEARTASLEVVKSGAGTRVDGGIVKLVDEAITADPKKSFATAMKDAIVEQKRALGALQKLKSEGTKTLAGTLLSPLQKTAMLRAETTDRVLKNFVRFDAYGAVQVVDASGSRTTVKSLAEFQKLLDANWDELYAAARLGM